jgi:hypothetical protein
MVTSPIYDSAYAYGRIAAVTQYAARPSVPRSAVSHGEWLKLKPGAQEGYVDWGRAAAIRGTIRNFVRRLGMIGAKELDNAATQGTSHT